MFCTNLKPGGVCFFALNPSHSKNSLRSRQKQHQICTNVRYATRTNRCGCRCVQEFTLYITSDLSGRPHQLTHYQNLLGNMSTWTLKFGVAANRHSSLFPVPLSSPGLGCQIGCFGVAWQPHMTLAVVVAAVQSGYSTDREALSDTTIAAARHNTDALTEGTGGMPLLCL